MTLKKILDELKAGYCPGVHRQYLIDEIEKADRAIAALKMRRHRLAKKILETFDMPIIE